MNKHKKTVYTIILVAAGLVVGLLIGFLTFGTWANQKQDEQTKKLQDFVNVIVPKPPEVISNVVANIKKIDGNILELEINDPEDYIPHTDGTLQKKIMRTGTIDTTTEITIVNPIKIDAAGKISEKNATIADLKEGDQVTILTDKNIRTETTFPLISLKKIVIELDEK